jgi:PAS domain S-box-containing protein
VEEPLGNTRNQPQEVEAALQNDSHFVSALLNVIGALVVVLDREGKIVRFNQACEQTTGYMFNEVQGKFLWDLLLLPAEVAEVKTVFYRLRSGHFPYKYENYWLTRDGSRRLIAWSNTVLLGRDEKVEYIIGTGIDITERQRAEEEKARLEVQLRRLQKMEAIGTFAEGIAHDFNNILSAILGYIELTLLTMGKGDDAGQVQANLKEMLRSVMRAQELVRQILTFSGQAEQENKPIQINLIIKGAINRLRAMLPTSIEIRHHIDPGGIVMADPGQIHQVVMNLCTNAYHSMRELGGVLEVRLEAVEVNAELAQAHPHLHKNGPYIRLTVKDTGHGMGPWVLERIFEPYFTTKGPGEGNGLGLTMVHSIVSSLGGAIMVDSEIGQGSTFQIYFPRIDRVIKLVDDAEPATSPEGGHILFVDDEKQIVQINQKILEHFGYQVSAYTSSLEALAAFRDHPEKFALVITDLIMPEMNGLELAEEIMRLRPNFPLILCTGFTETVAAEQAKKQGVREYLMKPITAANLVKAIQRILWQSDKGCKPI